MYTKLLKRKTSERWIVPIVLILFFIILVVLHINRQPIIIFFCAKPGYENLIRNAAKKHCLDPALLLAVAWNESRLNPNAKGTKGEVGLMQIRPKNGAVEEWAAAHNVKPPRYGLLFNPELNLEIGAWYLARAIRKWSGYKSQLELALSEYNAGATGMTPWIPDDPTDEVIEHITIASTQRYVRTIMDKYKQNIEIKHANK
jgi:soluble lytic murein transglycosylase